MIVTLLLAYGVDPTIENNYGHSPLSNSKRMQGTQKLVPQLESATKKEDLTRGRWQRPSSRRTNHGGRQQVPRRPYR